MLASQLMKLYFSDKKKKKKKEGIKKDQVLVQETV